MQPLNEIINGAIENPANEKCNSEIELSDLVFVMSPYIEQLIKKMFEDYKIKFFYDYKSALNYLNNSKKENVVKMIIIDEELNISDLSPEEQKRSFNSLIKNAKDKSIALVLVTPYLKTSYESERIKIKQDVFDCNEFYNKLDKNKEAQIYFFTLLESIEKIKKYLKKI
ncbi:MAG: hypothetical protein ACP5OZ_04965 [Candidatus Woesearchaeota archaeon]